MAVASFVVSVVAALLAAASALYTRSQARSARHQLEVMREEAAASEAERESHRRSPWVLSHFQNDAFALTNTWLYPLYDVRVVVPWSGPAGSREWGLIEPRASMTFLVAATEVGGSGANIEVRWRDDPNGEVLRWATVLPARR